MENKSEDRIRLSKEYKEYAEEEKRNWMRKNGLPMNVLYPLMDRQQREKADELRKKWSEHITLLTEEWWGERGYGCIWPENDQEPMQTYKLEISVK
ncbi:MAG: hypothetical protein K9M36_02625 [Candidatus Pacebacteria bacterium]|nr:hypothetical protein [Candidatus Paceibacterota bacterium]